MNAALIGLGMVANTFADAIGGSDKVRLARVHARRPDSNRAFLSAHSGLGATAAESVEEIASDVNIDFAIVATPPNARQEIVETLASAGKPILMEKPVERTLAAAESIVESCQESGVPLGIVFQHRARPAVAEFRTVLSSLGTLAAIEISVPWWRPQSYYEVPGRGTYERDGGGVLLTQAIHTLDLALHFAGEVTEVTAFAATSSLHDMESEDFVTAGLRFASGAIGHLFATTASYPGHGESITFHGREASARLEAGQIQIDWHDGRSERIGEIAESGAGTDPMAFTSDWHRAIIEDFAESLRSDRPPMVPGKEALRVHRLIDALERSSREGRKVLVGQPA